MKQWSGQQPVIDGCGNSEIIKLNNKIHHNMSRNLLDHARENRDMNTLKQAFKAIGCDCDFNDMDGAAEAIRKLSTVPTVVNAALMPGPGVKVTPIERKGYKLSANDEAQLVADISEKFRKGTSIHDVLKGIVHHEIPKAMKHAIRAPRVSDITVFKVYDDGIDYYDNPYFGPKGQGRKSGLQPCAWYIKLYTVAQVEPLYVCLSPMVEDLRREILLETRREADKAIEAAIHKLSHELGLHPIPWPGCGCDHKPEHKPGHGHHRPEKPVKPVEPIEPEDPGNSPIEPEEPTETTGPIIYEQPNDPDTPDISYDDPTGCPICDQDPDYGGYRGDDDFEFNVDPANDVTEEDDFENFLNQLDKDDE